MFGNKSHQALTASSNSRRSQPLGGVDKQRHVLLLSSPSCSKGPGHVRDLADCGLLWVAESNENRVVVEALLLGQFHQGGPM